MSVIPVYIPYYKKGISNPKCYLSVTKGCSDKISGEHYISKNLLDKIERINSTIDIGGTPWITKGHLKSIGKSSLTANILCEKHNSELSGLDSEIGGLVEGIYTIDRDFLNPTPLGHTFSLDGTHIERWILKTLVGMVESRVIVQPSGSPYLYKKQCIELICMPAVQWPVGWGLYVAAPKERIYHNQSFELSPKYDQQNGELFALGLKFNGFEMNFLMHTPTQNHSFGYKRPGEIIFNKGHLISKIKFNWHSHKVGLSPMFSQNGKYSGKAPGHDLPRAD